MTFLGIDPGAHGGLALISEEGVAAIPFEADSYLRILKAAAAESEVFCVLEHVGAMPGQGVSSTFAFGASFGWLQGVLEALGIPYELVRPQKWKKAFGCTSDKNTSVAAARRLFPGADLLPTPRSRKPHDGMAEALLMAEYARRIWHGRSKP